MESTAVLFAAVDDQSNSEAIQRSRFCFVLGLKSGIVAAMGHTLLVLFIAGVIAAILRAKFPSLR
jgi:uncharacterized membrane protein YdfJ with MMPL/SSD domain